MERRFRLTQSSDFQRVRLSGKSYAHPLLVLIARPNPGQDLRIGVTAGKSVGNAVQRNRAKRRLRACITSSICAIAREWDLVLIARKPCLDADFQELCSALLGLLKRAGLLVRTDE